MEHHIHTLQNGIRILFVPTKTTVSHACFLVNAGSRDESDAHMGLAHFIEHILFKRTLKRNTYQILNRIESVGGDLNAYTTKEYTCIHASFLNPYLERSTELFQDILFHSIFPEDEIEKERSVILDEIASYEDQPEESIQDDFEDLIFSGHPLGRNILGNVATVSQIKRENILNFIANNYRTHQMVFAVMGNYTWQKVKHLSEKYFQVIPENSSDLQRTAPVNLPTSHSQHHKPINQAHYILGGTGYSFHHPYKTGLMLLNHYLGAGGMSSVLNLEIREKYGIAYTIESNYIPLSDTGIFNIYLGTDEEKLKKAKLLITKELTKLQAKSWTSAQLNQLKKRLIGQIALAEENKIGLIISLAKSLLDFNYIDSLAMVFQKIEAVKPAEMNAIAKEVLNFDTLSSLTFMPSED
ncbi:MAG: insulinase family protein [Pedobacter sp.]|nr:MAG: insulinase family protein [Pedobacter sp.]